MPKIRVLPWGNVAMISPVPWVVAAMVTLPPAPHPNAQDFLFWRENISGREVVMIDTLERVEQHTVTAQDGQNRHRGGRDRRFKK